MAAPTKRSTPGSGTPPAATARRDSLDPGREGYQALRHAEEFRRWVPRRGPTARRRLAPVDLVRPRRGRPGRVRPGRSVRAGPAAREEVRRLAQDLPERVPGLRRRPGV